MLGEVLDPQGIMRKDAHPSWGGGAEEIMGLGGRVGGAGEVSKNEEWEQEGAGRVGTVAKLRMGRKGEKEEAELWLQWG